MSAGQEGEIGGIKRRNCHGRLVNTRVLFIVLKVEV